MSENLNDGGPAFPVHADHVTFNDRVVAAHHPGMSLRDYFAGQALTGLLVQPAEAEFGTAHFAAASYAMADAMLAARGEEVAK